MLSRHPCRVAGSAELADHHPEEDFLFGRRIIEDQHRNTRYILLLAGLAQNEESHASSLRTQPKFSHHLRASFFARKCCLSPKVTTCPKLRYSYSCQAVNAIYYKWESQVEMFVAMMGDAEFTIARALPNTGLIHPFP